MADCDDDWQEDEPEVIPERPTTYATTTTKIYRPSSGRGYSRGAPRSQYNDSNWRSRDSRNGDNRRNFSHQENGNKKIIQISSQMVGRVIGRGGSKIRDLQNDSDAKIKIGDSSGIMTDLTLCGSDEAISKVEDMINELTQERKPAPKAPVEKSKDGGEMSENFYKRSSDGVEVLDWNKLNEYYEGQQQERYKKLPPIIKDFYKEDPKVKAMSQEEVKRWRRANNDIQVKRTFDDNPNSKPIPNPVLTFEQAFQYYPEILEEIYKQKFTQPSPIQSQAWPILLSGEDLIGIAQTGTGKTLAFLLPALIHIEGQTIPRDQREGPTVLILAPTRELALQIDKEVSKYNYKDIKSVCLYGGGDRRSQIKVVSKGVDIVIATPGRLNDLVISGHLQVINFSYIVLDEADRMLDMGFEPQIRKSLYDIRPDRQTVMTSATWPQGVRRLAETYMKNPIQVNVGSLDLAAVHTVTQKVMFVEEDGKEEALFEFLASMEPTDKVIIFCGRKTTATHVTTELCLKGIDCQSLHGDRDQTDREAALDDMVDGTVKILVATDVASRGIDIKDLTHVINFDFPRQIEEYVHRVGRTGRAGKTGIALSFITRKDWGHAGELIQILEEANQEIPQQLEEMSERFEAMKKRKEREGGGSTFRGRGRGRGRGRW